MVGWRLVGEGFKAGLFEGRYGYSCCCLGNGCSFGIILLWKLLLVGLHVHKWKEKNGRKYIGKRTNAHQLDLILKGVRVGMEDCGQHMNSHIPWP
jgi:hypothetical protein